MRVQLVRPATAISVSELRPGAGLPIGLAYVAAGLRAAGHEVRVVDAVGEALGRFERIEGVAGVRRHGLSDESILERIRPGADLIGVACMFSTEWPLAKRLIRGLRSRHPESLIVAGGEHATACASFALRDCPELDCCVLGEGEKTIVALAETRGAGREPSTVAGICRRDGAATLRTPARERIKDLDSIPWPAWDLFPVREYIAYRITPGVHMGPSLPIMASRGCPFECAFCSNPAMWGRLWKARDPDQVLAEMKHAMREYGITNFDFFDPTAILRKDWILRMARLIVDHRLGVTWQLPSGTRSEALDEEVASWLHRSGCRNIIYAPESGSDATLERIRKRISKPHLVRSIRGAVRSGIKTKANFVIGFPDETVGNVLESMGFAIRLAWAGLHDASFFPFSPYPGSALFDRLDAQGKLALDDGFFYGLICNKRSVDEHIPGWLAPILAHAGMLAFYLVSFTLRPGRVFGLARSLWRREPQTRLESALLRWAENRFGRHGAPVEQGGRA
ncbi:MAG: B12-binding domain-containing radical SAM protein [Elusimicrobia bacterium]|nr:B12-binding domain-containing radical SAM protein [Elusimicrobiota bacterium]